MNMSQNQCWNELDRLESVQRAAEAMQDWSYLHTIEGQLDNLRLYMVERGYNLTDPLVLVLAGQ